MAEAQKLVQSAIKGICSPLYSRQGNIDSLFYFWQAACCLGKVPTSLKTNTPVNEVLSNIKHQCFYFRILSQLNQLSMCTTTYWKTLSSKWCPQFWLPTFLRTEITGLKIFRIAVIIVLSKMVRQHKYFSCSTSRHNIDLWLIPLFKC